MIIKEAHVRQYTCAPDRSIMLALKAHYEAVQGVGQVMLTILVPHFQHGVRCPDC